MVHIPLLLLFPDGVQLLGGGEGVQGADGQHLGLAPGEEAGAVDAGQHAHLGGQGTDLVLGAPVYAVALQQPGLDDLLLELVGELLQVLVHVGVLLQILLMPMLDHGVPAGFPDVLVVGVHGGLGLVHEAGDDVVEQLLIEIGVGVIELLLADLGHHLIDEGHLLLVLLVGGLDGLEHHVVGDLVGPGLDHDHLFPGGDHGHVHVGGLGLPGVGVDHDLTVHQTHLHRAHRSVPGDVGDGQGGGGADEGGHLGGAVPVHAHDGSHDGHVIAEVAGEQGADGPVDDPAGEDALLTGTALPAHEGAGDAAYGIHLLLKVHAEREEINAVPGPGGGGTEDGGLAVGDQHGGVGQLGQLAGFQSQGTARQIHGVLTVVGKLLSGDDGRHSVLLFICTFCSVGAAF